jgi:hypothetical protein
MSPSFGIGWSIESAGMSAPKLRALWCDGFIPDKYLLSAPNPRIVGRVWIAKGPRWQDRSAVLRSGWIIEADSLTPKLTTCYPL